MYGSVSFCPNSFTTQEKKFFESDYVYQMFTIIVYSRYETNSIPIYVISLYFSTEQIHNLQPKSYLPPIVHFYQLQNFFAMFNIQVTPMSDHIPTPKKKSSSIKTTDCMYYLMMRYSIFRHHRRDLQYHPLLLNH